MGEVGDGDVFAVVLVKEGEGRSEFFVFTERGGALIEGASNADDTANISLMVEERFFGGGGPIDEPAAARDEFDTVDDRFSSFKNTEVVLADVFQDVRWDEIIVAFVEDVFGFKDFTKAGIPGDVAEVAVFDEVDEAGEVVEDGGEMVLDVVLLKELVILH